MPGLHVTASDMIVKHWHIAKDVIMCSFEVYHMLRLLFGATPIALWSSTFCVKLLVICVTLTCLKVSNNFG